MDAHFIFDPISAGQVTIIILFSHFFKLETQPGATMQSWNVAAANFSSGCPSFLFYLQFEC